MARLPRLVMAGQAHRVRLQGHNGQPIVLDAADAAGWRELLRDAAVTHRVAVHAWALEADRFDLVVTPASAEGLSRMMQSLARRHAAAFNRRHGRSGTLWDGRFCCALLAPAVVADAMVAVEAPQREGGSAAWGSSLAHHLGEARDPAVTEPAAWWAMGNTPFEREAAWRSRTAQGLTAEHLSALEAALRRGRPFGSAQFLADLSHALGRPVAPRPRGRPRRDLPAHG